MIALRDYQIEARDSVLRLWDSDVQSVMVAMATGTGKTETFLSVLAAERARGRYSRSLIVAHRKELVEQPRDRILSHWADSLPVPGIVMAEQNEADAELIVATIQTLGVERRWKELLRYGAFSHVVIDEAHHATNSSFMNLLNQAKAANGNVRILGVTATPKRSDKDGLSKVFSQVAYRISIKDAIVKLKCLSPFVAMGVSLPIDISSVHVRGDDYDSEELGNVMSANNAMEIIVETWRKQAYGRQTMAFTASVHQAQMLSGAFNDAGVPAAWASGETPKHERAMIVDAFRHGDIQVLTNCQIWGEGFDAPETSCVLMARPTRSDSVYIQAVGRGLRLAPAKTDCIAEGQRVLTDQGLIPIEQVTLSMKVWDGLSFVSHDGAICRGYQEVINYAGLTATPDHKVWTDHGWKQFGECATRKIPIAITGIGRTAIRETDSYRRCTPNEEWVAISTHALYHMRQRGLVVEGQSATRHCGVWQMRTSRNGWTGIVAGSKVALSPRAVRTTTMYQSKQRKLLALWRARHRISIRVAASNGALGQRESWVTSGHGNRPNRQQQPLRVWQPTVCDRSAKYRQQQEAKSECRVSCLPIEVSRSKVRGCNFTPILVERNETRRNHREIQSTLKQTKRRVWDILNAGPLHRFTAEGLLVSNCVIIDFVPVGGRDLKMAGDLLGKPKQQRAHEAKAGEAGVILDAFGIAVNGTGIDGDPDEVIMKALDYFAEQSTIKWTFDGGIGSVSIAKSLSLAIVLPMQERVRRAHELKQAGQWQPAWDEILAQISGYQVYVLNGQAQLLSVTDDWEQATHVAEEYFSQYGDASLARREHQWRGLAPSEKQALLATRLGIWTDGMTRGDCAQAITHAFTRNQLMKAKVLR